MPETEAEQTTETGIPQLSEADSALIYDEMLATGRIIEVTSGGVRVFDTGGVFIREEVLKAMKVFPRIDITAGLERVLERVLEHDEVKIQRVRTEIYNSLYRPIRHELDELVNDSRVFLSDSPAVQHVKTDLNNVIDRLDMLTLGLLNEILNESGLAFRRHIEAGAYCGLAGSVVFGDYKKKLTDKKVVEDLIMMGLVFGLGPKLAESTSFKELNRTSKSFYDVERVLEEVRTNPDKPSNILTEILVVALNYIKALDEHEERDTLWGLVALLESCNPSHAVAAGALAQKYAISEYMLHYLRHDGTFQDRLRASEGRFERILRQRMKSERSSGILKLGELFLRQFRYKATIRHGADTLRRLDEFVGMLAPVGVMVQQATAALAENDRPEAETLSRQIKTVSQVIENCTAFHGRHHDPAQWPGLDNMPGGAYLVAYRWSAEIEYHIQSSIRALARCHEQAGPLVAALGDPSMREAFAQCAEQVEAANRFQTTIPTCPFNIVHVLDHVELAFMNHERLGLFARIPESAINVVVDANQLEAVLHGLLTQIGEASGDTEAAGDKKASAGQKLSAGQKASSSKKAPAPVTLSARVAGGRCVVEIRDLAGRVPRDVRTLQAQTQAMSPGASLHVDVDPAAGATFLFEFPLYQGEKGA